MVLDVHQRHLVVSVRFSRGVAGKVSKPPHRISRLRLSLNARPGHAHLHLPGGGSWLYCGNAGCLIRLLNDGATSCLRKQSIDLKIRLLKVSVPAREAVREMAPGAPAFRA